MEGDSSSVISWMKFGGPGSWRITHSVKEARYLASNKNSLFHWVPREANSSKNNHAKSGVHRVSMYMASFVPN